MTDLPKSIKASGYMVDSKFKGNGFTFDSLSLEEMVEGMVGFPFVKDHDMSIDAIAGVVTSARAEPYSYEVELKKDDETETKVKQAVRIWREVSLNENFPAYESVARSIIALREAGAMPQTSMSISAETLSFDEETGDFILGGRMNFVHDSHVSTGAFSPREDVGLKEVEFSMEPMTLSVENGADEQEIEVACSVKVHNLEDLVVNFTADNLSTRPELVEKLGVALGQDLVPGEETVTETQEAETSEPEIGAELQSAAPTLNTEETTRKGETMPEDEHAMMEAAPEAEAPAQTEAAAGPSVEAENRLAELEAKVAELVAEKEAAQAAAFDAKRAEILAKHADLEEKLAVCTTIDQLDLVAELAARKSNPLPAEEFTLNKPAINDDGILGSKAQAREWHAARVSRLMGGA